MAYLKSLKLALILFLVIFFTGEASAKIFRSSKERKDFMNFTGYPKGRPGYVIDHIIPLCLGGPDKVYNMQWQTIQEAKVKDRLEKQQCAIKRSELKKP